MRSKFKDEHPFGWWRLQSMSAICTHQLPCILDKRKAEAERIRQKYPDRIPVRPPSFVSHISHSMLVRTLLRTTQSAGHLREG